MLEHTLVCGREDRQVFCVIAYFEFLWLAKRILIRLTYDPESHIVVEDLIDAGRKDRCRKPEKGA
ncbi:MAG: hypothetical protein OXF20_10705 [Gammaproteobacteria bacterium]|nr:hypothetical protein [Gammaproteobacteria bacterium]